MKSIDALLDRQYNAKHYHCVHFVLDAAQYLFDKDYSDYFISLRGEFSPELKKRHIDYDYTETVELTMPADGCVVLMTNMLNQAHVGLFYQGRVLHISEHGVRFQTIRTLANHYTGFKYYVANDLS